MGKNETMPLLPDSSRPIHEAERESDKPRLLREM